MEKNKLSILWQLLYTTAIFIGNYKIILSHEK